MLSFLYLPNPPTAEAGGSYQEDANTTITFNGLGSRDPDGTITNYTWDFGDGTKGYGISPAHVYISAGNYTVTLTVKDDDGAMDNDTTTAIILLPKTEQKTPGFEIVSILEILAAFLIWKRTRRFS